MAVGLLSKELKQILAIEKFKEPFDLYGLDRNYIPGLAMLGKWTVQDHGGQ